MEEDGKRQGIDIKEFITRKHLVGTKYYKFIGDD